jgi:tRNA(Arg) A34 adenosine deaminase TadA
MTGERDLVLRAIDLAVRNAEAGQLPFGAVVLHRGAVLASGVNTELRDHDPTAHAEVDAIRAACRRLHTRTLPEATLVSSCEPCALCQVTAATAGIERVVYAAPSALAIARLGAPETPQAALLAEMQHSLRSLAPERLVHIPSDRAAEPFERYLRRARAVGP